MCLSESVRTIDWTPDTICMCICTRICYIDSMISTFCLLNKIYFTSTICTLVYYCCLIKLSKKAVVLVCKKKLEIFVLTCIYSIKQLHYNGIVIISFLICYQVLLLTSDIFVDMFKFMWSSPFCAFQLSSYIFWQVDKRIRQNNVTFFSLSLSLSRIT